MFLILSLCQAEAETCSQTGKGIFLKPDYGAESLRRIREIEYETAPQCRDATRESPRFSTLRQPANLAAHPNISTGEKGVDTK